MTLTALREFSNLKLASDSDITAAEHREVNDAIFDFLQTLLPLASGTFSIGDITTTDVIMTVTFPDVGVADYKIEGQLYSNGLNYSNDNDVIFVIRERTRTSFKLALREVSPNIQNLSFEWQIKAKN